MSVDELIDESKKQGLDGVCLTEHDAFWTLDEAQELSRRHDFLVLPGTELNTDSGHVLVFGLESYVFGVHKPEFLRRLVDQQGGVIIAAHPYRRRFLEEPARNPEARVEMLEQATKDDFFGYCDAIEEINGRGTALDNRFSQDLVQRLALKATGGSDAHRTHQLGVAATRFEEKIGSLSDLIEELQQGRFCAVDLQGDTDTG